MPHKVLVVYPHKCVGCRICEQWCAQTHHGGMNPAKARLAVHRVHERQLDVPVVCSQCIKAPCIDGCPARCISRSEETFGLVLSREECLACRICVDRCVRGCIKMDADEEVPLLCDLCGGDPQCVKHCPEGAVQYVWFDQVDRRFRERHAIGLLNSQGGER